MNTLPRKTILGKLRYFEIYDNFDGPKCFSVLNNLEQLYLVYWSGDFVDEGVSKWLYASISHKRLDNLRRKKFSIREIFLNPEQFVYNVEIPFDEGDSTVHPLDEKAVQASNIPPSIFYLEPDEIEVCAKEANWNFELKIAKKSKSSSIVSSTVTKVIDALSAVIQSLMDDDSREKPRLYPLTATYGSFEVKLGTNYHEKSSVAINQLNDLLSDPESLDYMLKDMGLDPYKLKDLLDIVVEDSIELTLLPKTNEYLAKGISIKSSSLSSVIKKLHDSTTTFIDSTLVPQASNIDRIIDIVCRKVEGEVIKHENVEGLTSNRQIIYYINAAYCLGLLNKNKLVTAAGRLLHHRKTKDSQYLFLANRFESSDLAWAWMKWSKVDSIYDIDENTAEKFIKDCVKGLNSETSARRSSTITTWLKFFKQYRTENELSVLSYDDLEDESSVAS